MPAGADARRDGVLGVGRRLPFEDRCLRRRDGRRAAGTSTVMAYVGMAYIVM